MMTLSPMSCNCVLFFVVPQPECELTVRNHKLFISVFLVPALCLTQYESPMLVNEQISSPKLYDNILERFCAIFKPIKGCER